MSDAVNRKTLELALFEALSLRSTLIEWVDALDSKAATALGIMLVLIALVPALTSESWSGWRAVPWYLAVASALVGGLAAWRAFRVQVFTMGPFPHTMNEEDWLSFEPAEYREWRFRELQQEMKPWANTITKKALALQVAHIALICEGVMLALGVLTTIHPSLEVSP
jgi:hypothetical protein